MCNNSHEFRIQTRPITVYRESRLPGLGEGPRTRCMYHVLYISPAVCSGGNAKRCAGFLSTLNSQLSKTPFADVHLVIYGVFPASSEKGSAFLRRQA